MEQCLFCKLSLGASLIQNLHFFSVFDRLPASPGHALVIPKRHVVSLFELSGDEWAGLQDAISQCRAAIESSDLKSIYAGFESNPVNENSASFSRQMLQLAYLGTKPDGYNIGLNEGEAAGRTIHHLHIHIIPRFKGDVPDHAGGVRNVIPNRGNYLK